MSFTSEEHAKPKSFGVWPLEFNSSSCVGQGLITNATDYVWISCTTSLHRGRILRNEQRAPVSVTIELSNRDALDGPRSLNPDYGHIGDGDYVVSPSTGEHEIWFGLEDGEWPRRANAAVVRYDSSTLEYKGVHIHPSLKYLAWLAYDPTHQRAYGSEWEGVEELSVFDANQMNWSNETIRIDNIPSDSNITNASGINYIQGADVKDDILYLMTDDFKSSLFLLELQKYKTTVVDVQHLGLGNEREGIAILDSYLFSFGNRWRTWENISFAQVLCLPLFFDGYNYGPVPLIPYRSVNDRIISFSAGSSFGLLFSILLVCLWQKRKDSNTRIAGGGATQYDIV
mmetsp:Transcript_26546/g.52885  ORF Transcript_26546/g.52885 Transcript_26546/m.52885 type:complete len:342 (+) Transcript_26546:62-1087(+)